MYEYTFVPIRADSNFFIYGSMEGHREIIVAKAAEGWRYNGWLPVEQSTSGIIRTAELVFERELK